MVEVENVLLAVWLFTRSCTALGPPYGLSHCFVDDTKALPEVVTAMTIRSSREIMRES